MSSAALFMEHWINIDSERLGRYETMYRWSDAAEAFYAPADIRPGQIVVDFGCGPGHTAIEFARRIKSGHVHALDINTEFIKRARARAEANGVGDRVTAQLLTSERLPLPDGVADRVVTRNTIVYVHDPVNTFMEFRRVLKPGGIAHAIEGDWSLTAVEPLAAEWRSMVKAASWAWRTPEIGRKLPQIVRQAGFSEMHIQVLTRPDTEGRLFGMIETVAGYARASDALAAAQIEESLNRLKNALQEGTYFAVAPQFLVTAKR
jgi:ubiquinone/menaquinone biosynthesis C-methylase UbiE